MAIHVVRVTNLPHLEDARGRNLLFEIRASLGIGSISKIATAKVYRFEGLELQDVEFLARHLLCAAVHEQYTIDQPIISGADRVVEVAYKPGVMNPEVGTIVKAVRDFGIAGLVAADSSMEYGFYGDFAAATIDLVLSGLLVNDTVEMVVEKNPTTLVIHGTPEATATIPVRTMSDEDLMDLSKDKLFLNLQEMRAIKEHFISLDRDPTDCEVETLAQTWSEHCLHKTFKSPVVVDGEPKEPFLHRLQKATAEARHPLVLSAFVDNSGVIELFDGLAVCGKVETHNSPSAIEPYGGAMTGAGGVFRDIMGTGKGAKVIAASDMFCLAPPDTPAGEVPPGCLHPNYLLRRVVAGVRDYGNRMGIPTINGSVHFHRDFRAKPTIICGAYGMMPVEDALKGEPQEGDIAVIVGGRTGRDGIHGATFSSGEMTHRTVDVNSSTVQIGNAMEEKRFSEALLLARDEKIIRAITDCGAGGFASAFGEMGEKTGVKIQLDRVPVKYPGLAPWEIWLSESQERMALAVAPRHLERILEIFRLYNVEAVAVGEFTATGRLEVYYGQQCVCSLDMDFLHRGVPRRTLVATTKEHPVALQEPARPTDWLAVTRQVMEHLNVCSKEPIVRMFDHGAQGGNALPPFGGLDENAPNNAAVVVPVLGQKFGLVVAHGLNPVLNQIDPYAGTLWAATEAVANAVSAGANPADLVLIDNFIWPYPDEESLADLDRSVDACTDFVRATGMPFISGKDSLSSTYRYPDGQVLKIPPVICISCFGRVADVTTTVSSDFKQPGSEIILVGRRNIEQMGGSTYFEVTGASSPRVPEVDLAILPAVLGGIYQGCREGAILACHDLSHGGVLGALAEMCFGGGMGATIVLPRDGRWDYFLFNETAGCFLVELAPGVKAAELLTGVPYLPLGHTLAEYVIKARHEEKILFELPVAELMQAWQKPLKEVFGS